MNIKLSYQAHPLDCLSNLDVMRSKALHAVNPDFGSLSSDQAEKERQMVQESIEKLQVSYV
jgi:hypothetical protein